MKVFIKTLLFSLILGSSTAIFAQMPAYGKQAEALYNSGIYAEAAKAMIKASAKTNVKTEDSRRLKAEFEYKAATCYRYLHDFAAAEQLYEKAIVLKYFDQEPKVYYYLAEMQMAQKKHKEAIRNYKKYDRLNGGDPLTKVRIESCEKYDDFIKNEGRHEMSPMTKLNTTQFDFGTVMDSRGKYMYFTSTRPASNGDKVDGITYEDYSDIYISEIDRKGNYSEPQPLPAPINTIHNEGTPAFDGRGKKMFFTRCVDDGDNNLGCDIYMTEKKGSSYSEPVKLALKDHDSTHVGHPAVSKDGNTLIFASNMAGGQGGLDLWMSTYERRADSWSLPVNLGPGINTAGNDEFPQFGENGVLIYASDGMVGLGGLDLYVAQKKGDKNEWKSPVNMGAPLNSVADDYHIIYTQDDAKGTKGFLSSNRAGSKGRRENPSQDIWSFFLPPVVIDVVVEVLNQETNEPVANKEVKLIGSDGSNVVLNTDENGMIELGAKADGSRYVKTGVNYVIDVPSVPRVWLGNKDKFETLQVEKPTKFFRAIKILDISKPLRIPEVRYNFGSAELQVTPECNSKDSLNYVYDIMMANPNIIVQLMSHTDSRGSAEANRKLA
ncbi:MAG: hypothetical protein AB8B72_06155, partial [Crocinitomicaceae bacterium]